MTNAQHQPLFENAALVDPREYIKQRHEENSTHADPAYGACVAKALGMKELALATGRPSDRRWDGPSTGCDI